MNRPHLVVIAGRPVTPPARDRQRKRPEGRDLEWMLPLLIVISSATVVGVTAWGLTWLPW